MTRPARRRSQATRFPVAHRLAAAVVLAVAALLALRFLVADDGYAALLSRRSELRRVEAEVEAVLRRNAELRRQARALVEDLYPVERIAREELDLAAPGELIYLFPADVRRRAAEPRPERQ